MSSPSRYGYRRMGQRSRSPRGYHDGHDRRRSRSRSPVLRRGANRRSRSTTPPRRRRRGHSDSRSPDTGPSKRDLESIRISVPNVSTRRKDDGKALSARRDRDGPKFEPNEEDMPRTKDQKKIQIEIRRNIPYERVSKSPVRRSIRNPVTVFVSRRRDEGASALFDRDEIKRFVPDVPEKRVIAMVGGGGKDEAARRSRSPLDRDRMHSDRQRSSRDIRDRLGTNGARPATNSSSVRDRLGYQNNVDRDRDRVLDRDELESQRPDVKPWEVNPEFVPRGSYFEHDNRESFTSFRGRGRGFNNHFNNRGRGFSNYRNGRGRGGGGYYNNSFTNRRYRDHSPDWKHDKFQDVADDKPSSTTD